MVAFINFEAVTSSNFQIQKESDVGKSSVLPGESKKTPAFERLLLPEYISNDIFPIPD